MVRTVLLTAVAAAIIAADWLRLEQPQRVSPRVLALIAVAIAPALLRPWWLRVAGAAAALLAGAAIAFSVAAAAFVPGSRAALFAPVVHRFGSAVVDFYAYRLPVDPTVHERMHMLILFAIFAFALLVGLAVSARRPVVAVAAFLVGAGWPATLLGGGHELMRGALILLVALALLAGLSVRRTGLAAPGALVVLLGALALSSAPAVAKPAFLNWQHWNPYVRPVKPVSVSYVWNAQYTGLHFPRKVTTVLTIRAPQSIGTYWRATVLDRFDGERWLEHVWRESDLERYQLVPPAARQAPVTVQQEVTVDALADQHLIGASVPVAYNISEPATYLGQDVAVATDGLHRGQRYIAWSYVAQPSAGKLVRSPATYPDALTKPGRELDVAPGVTSPAFGVPGREARLEQRLVGPLVPYAQLLARARVVVGDTHSPYAATVALEQWFRASGGFTYSVNPPQTPGLPPLAAFVLQTKTGYCQHFAGAMALMARLLGIPARVAVGFVRGRYADGAWTITDHDAHAWVEVWFRGYGWLPFDPTPGRGRLAAPYSAASARFDPVAEAKLLAGIVRGGEVFGAIGHGNTSNTPNRGRSLHSAADVGVRGLKPHAPSSHRQSLVLFLLLVTAGVAAAIASAKFLRRRLRYLTRDPRKIATACARELSEFLLDQGMSVSIGSTFGELGRAIEDRLAVDAHAFVFAAEAARFGPPDGARAAAHNARGELQLLKKRLRNRLFVLERARGLVSLRSLGFS